MRSLLRRHHMLLVSTILGLAAFALSFQVIAGYTESAKVVLLARDVEPLSVLGPDDVIQSELPKAAVSRDCFQDAGDAIGRVAMSRLYAGQALLLRQTAPEGSRGLLSLGIPQGQRAIFVPLSGGSGLSDLIHEGETVDIIFAPKSTVGFSEGEGADVLPGVRVLQVLNDDAPGGSFGLVVIGSQEDCVWIAQHAERGSLHIALHSAMGDGSAMSEEKWVW